MLDYARQCSKPGGGGSTRHPNRRPLGRRPDIFAGRLKFELDWLQSLGWPVGRKRVRRLLRTMGLEAIYPKPRLSTPAPDHRIYPYLLRGVAITRPNQVWCTDITYIRLARGFVYLTAVIDWFSRYVLSWRLSVTLDADFCIEALGEALGRYGRPEIFNSDQGSQFTSDAFTGVLLDADIRISMDGRSPHRSVLAVPFCSNM